jgi:hypothetical protein
LGEPRPDRGLPRGHEAGEDDGAHQGSSAVNRDKCNMLESTLAN